MNDDLHNFLKDLFVHIQKMYDNSVADESKAGNEADAAYSLGTIMAYYSVLDLIKSQLNAFGYDKESSEFIVPKLGIKDKDISQNEKKQRVP
jgi:hypothetical protein